MERPDGSSRHRRGLSGLGSGASSPGRGREGEDDEQQRDEQGAGTGLGRLNDVEVEEGLRRRREGELGAGQ